MCKKSWTMCYFLSSALCKEQKSFDRHCYECIFDKASEEELIQECEKRADCNLYYSYILPSNECYPFYLRAIRSYNAMKKQWNVTS